jgi:hypothetical protein
MLTRRVVEKRINEAIEQFEALDSIIGKVQRIRVETLG